MYIVQTLKQPPTRTIAVCGRGEAVLLTIPSIRLNMAIR